MANQNFYGFVFEDGEYSDDPPCTAQGTDWVIVKRKGFKTWRECRHYVEAELRRSIDELHTLLHKVAHHNLAEQVKLDKDAEAAELAEYKRLHKKYGKKR